MYFSVLFSFRFVHFCLVVLLVWNWFCMFEVNFGYKKACKADEMVSCCCFFVKLFIVSIFVMDSKPQNLFTPLHRAKVHFKVALKFRGELVSFLPCYFWSINLQNICCLFSFLVQRNLPKIESTFCWTFHLSNMSFADNGIFLPFQQKYIFGIWCKNKDILTI
jgi:hypothetical protein